MPINKCIRVAESEQPAKIDYLRKSNFLSEFSTAQDKAKVRQILGIPESASFFWQDLQGLPQRNTDLVGYIDNKLLPINNRINDQQTTINGLSESYQEIIGQLSGVESIGDLVSTVEDLKAKVYKNISDIAQNSVKILELAQGGITPSPQYDVQTLTQRIEAVESRAQALENSRVTNSYLDGKLTEYQKLISDIDTIRNNALIAFGYEVRIAELERLVGEDTLNEHLSFSKTSASGTENGTATLTIKAVYSKSGDRIITEDSNLICDSEDHTIAVWNNQTYKIDLLSPGTTILNFEYTDSKNNTATGSVTITVNQRQSNELTYYIGYATSTNKNEGHLVGNSDFSIRSSSNTIEVTGDALYKYSGCDLGNGQLAQGVKFWFCCPSTKNLTEWHEETIGLNDDHVVPFNTSSNVTLGNETYKLYYIGTLRYNNIKYTFKIN